MGLEWQPKPEQCRKKPRMNTEQGVAEGWVLKEFDRRWTQMNADGKLRFNRRGTGTQRMRLREGGELGNPSHK